MYAGVGVGLGGGQLEILISFFVGFYDGYARPSCELTCSYRCSDQTGPSDPNGARTQVRKLCGFASFDLAAVLDLADALLARRCHVHPCVFPRALAQPGLQQSTHHAYTTLQDPAAYKFACSNWT
jgi:hypothetical protein